MKKTLLSTFLAVLMAMPLSAADAPAANGTTVNIDNFSFTPTTLEVPRGSTVTWVNKDDIPHVVASTDNKFKSRAIDTDGTFTFTFAEPGTYEYFCSVHPVMTGKVIVK